MNPGEPAPLKLLIRGDSVIAAIGAVSTLVAGTYQEDGGRLANQHHD